MTATTHELALHTQSSLSYATTPSTPLVTTSIRFVQRVWNTIRYIIGSSETAGEPQHHFSIEAGDTYSLPLVIQNLTGSLQAEMIFFVTEFKGPKSSTLTIEALKISPAKITVEANDFSLLDLICKAPSDATPGLYEGRIGLDGSDFTTPFYIRVLE